MAYALRLAPASDRARLPAWLAFVWSPRLISVWRCEWCFRIYRRQRDLPARGRCATEGCGGAVVQWKRCSVCRRWKDESGFYRSNNVMWLSAPCRRCHTRRVSAAITVRYRTDPAWAAAERQRKREAYARRRGPRVSRTKECRTKLD